MFKAVSAGQECARKPRNGGTVQNLRSVRSAARARPARARVGPPCIAAAGGGHRKRAWLGAFHAPQRPQAPIAQKVASERASPGVLNQGGRLGALALAHADDLRRTSTHRHAAGRASDPSPMPLQALHFFCQELLGEGAARTGSSTKRAAVHGERPSARPTQTLALPWLARLLTWSLPPDMPRDSAKLSSAAVGSLPGDSTKSSGVVELPSANAPADARMHGKRYGKRAPTHGRKAHGHLSGPVLGLQRKE